MMRLRETRRSLQNEINQKVEQVDNVKTEIENENRRLQMLLYEQRILNRDLANTRRQNMPNIVQLAINKAPVEDKNSKIGQVLMNLSSKSMQEHNLKEDDIR